ncbi:hypothetical protein J6590_048588 [Homalodisca vitripennis]|nr:hypothetical protein J6590_048588 [Homalodisca vitripennis]
MAAGAVAVSAASIEDDLPTRLAPTSEGGAYFAYPHRRRLRARFAYEPASRDWMPVRSYRGGRGDLSDGFRQRIDSRRRRQSDAIVVLVPSLPSPPSPLACPGASGMPRAIIWSFDPFGKKTLSEDCEGIQAVYQSRAVVQGNGA